MLKSLLARLHGRWKSSIHSNRHIRLPLHVASRRGVRLQTRQIVSSPRTLALSLSTNTLWWKINITRTFEHYVLSDGKTILYKYKGELYSLVELEDLTGVPKSTIQTRISRTRCGVYHFDSFEDLIHSKNTCRLKTPKTAFNQMYELVNKAIKPLEETCES